MTIAAQVPVFELIAGHTALDFVNSLDWRFREGKPEELLNSYSDVLRFMQQAKLLTPRAARQLECSANESAAQRVLLACRELREAAADVFYAAVEGRSPTAGSLKILEKDFKAARAHQSLAWNQARLRWDWSGMEAAPELPLWLLSLNASGLLLSENMSRLRACNNDECRWLFLDTSKNHTRRWCDMKICGNRMKARRFKAQRRD